MNHEANVLLKGNTTKSEASNNLLSKLLHFPSLAPTDLGCKWILDSVLFKFPVTKH